MRRTYRYCTKAERMVPAGMEWRQARADNGAPSLLCAPQVWGVMPETLHMIDQRVYDSREQYAATTRANGAIEVGHAEMKKLQERGPRPVETGPTVEQSIKAALEQHGHM